MIILFIIAFILLILLLLNEYYYWVVCDDQQYIHMLKGEEGGPYDAIAFGSAYCRYGLDFSNTGIKGYNFGYGSQFFYYTNLMLRQYAKTCKKGGVVYLIIADLVFAKEGKGLYGADQYVKFINSELLVDEYSVFKFFKARFPLLFKPRLIARCLRRMVGKDIKDTFNTLEYNELNKSEVEASAEKRCNSWCRQFGLNNTIDPVVPKDLEDIFVKTRQLLTSMIQFCLDNDLKPVLVVTPVSGIMNKKISDSFINRVLFDNIQKANVQRVPLLNYLRDKDFEDYNLYYNSADCLNVRGRRLFTQKLLADTANL